VTENAMLFARAFAPGFDFYREEKGLNVWDTRGDIETTFGAGLQWIRGHARERFFLFLHTYQVHSPYLPPPEYDLWKTWTHDDTESPIDGTTPAYVRDRALYAGEVRYTDAVVGRLFGELERLGVLSDTIVIVTSDHGEEFAEHGGREHARTVYEELLHVPLVVVAPGLVPAGLTIEAPVSLVDVVPTLLALGGIAAPPGVQGRSLAGLMRGDPFPSDRVLFAEKGPLSDTRRLVAARKGSMKWIFRSDREGKPEIYDLAADPHEQHSLASPDLVAAGRPLFAAHREMRDRARRWRGSDGESGPVPANVDDDVTGKLRALGYLD
jgi:arylsulfatase A-like enzyme